MKWASWNWDNGAGRQHNVVAELQGAIETPDGLADTPVLLTACGRIRPAASATVIETEGFDLPEGDVHETCRNANGRAIARGISRPLSALVAPDA